MLFYKFTSTYNGSYKKYLFDLMISDFGCSLLTKHDFGFLKAPEENTEMVTEAETEPEEPDHQKVEVPLGGNVQLHCPKGIE